MNDSINVRTTANTDKGIRGSEPRHRPTVSDLSEIEDSYPGQEVLLENSDGTQTLAKRIGDTWHKTDPTTSDSKVLKHSDGRQKLTMVVGGKRFRVFLEEDE